MTIQPTRKLRAAIAVLYLFLLSACGSVSRDTVPQETHNTEIESGRKSLFDGGLTYSDLAERTLREDEGFTFRVSVSGRRAPQSPRPTVRVGTTTGAKLHCIGAGAHCTPLSSERQSVVKPTDTALWEWHVQPHRAGKLTLSATFTSYLSDTDTVLHESRAITVKGTVRPKARPPSQSPSTVEKGYGGVKAIATEVVWWAVSACSVAIACATFKQLRRGRPDPPEPANASVDGDTSGGSE